MVDNKQSKVLDELASFYVSQTNFDFHPNVSPGTSTPQTSDSEQEPPIQVDPAILLELKNLFLNNTTVEPIRRTKAPLRAKHSMGGTTSERKSKRPSSSRSLAPPSSTKPTRENGASRRVMIPSGGVSVNDEAFSAARERLKMRSKSMSSPRQAGSPSTALELHLEQARSKSQVPGAEILDRSVQLQSRASRRTGGGNDGEELSNILSGNNGTSDRKNRTLGKSRRSTPNRSKSADLADFTSVVRRVNERGDASRRRQRDSEVEEISASDTPKVDNASKSIAEVDGFISNASKYLATPVASLSVTGSPSILNDDPSHKAPTRPRSFSDRRSAAPLRSKSGDLTSFIIPRFQSRDTERAPPVAADEQGNVNCDTSSLVLESDNATTFEPLNDQAVYKETSSQRNPPIGKGRRRTPSRNKSSDLADLSVNRYGMKGGDAPTDKQQRSHSEEVDDHLAADAWTTLDSDKSIAAVGKFPSTPRIAASALVRNDGYTLSSGVRLVDIQVPLNDEERRNAPSKPRSFLDQQGGAFIRDKSSDIEQSQNRDTGFTAVITNNVGTGDFDEANLDLDLDDCTTEFVPLNDADVTMPIAKAKGQRRIPSRSRSADLGELNTSRWGNDRGDAPTDMRHVRYSEKDSAVESRVVPTHKSASAVGKHFPKRLVAPDPSTRDENGETPALSNMSSGISLEVNRSSVKKEEFDGALSRPRSFSERKRMTPQVEEGTVATRQHRRRTNRLSSESEHGGNANSEKHTSNHHRRNQRSGGAIVPSSAHHRPSSRTPRVESSGTFDSNRTDSQPPGILSRESVDDQAETSMIHRLDPSTTPVSSIEVVPDRIPSFPDEIEPSHHTDSLLLDDLVEKKPVKPSSFIFKGLLHKRKNEIVDGNGRELERNIVEVAATRKVPMDKAHEKRGLSVLKNLLKGSSHEKKSSRWGVIKASIDVSSALMKAAGTERKHDTEETQSEGASELEEFKVEINGTKSQKIPSDARHSILTSPPSPAMMMSISSFAPEDVEGLVEFHASLSTESKPLEGKSTTGSQRKGVRRSRSGEDPPTMAVPRGDYISPVNDRRRAMGRLDPPSRSHIVENFVVRPTIASTNIETRYMEYNKKDEKNDGEAEFCITDSPAIQVRLDGAEGSMLDTARMSASLDGEHESSHLDSKAAKSRSTEISISVQTVKTDSVVRLSSPDCVVVVPRNTENSGPSEGEDWNEMDFGIRTNETLRDGEAPDVLDMNCDSGVKRADLNSEISLSSNHEHEPTASPGKFMQLDFNSTKSRSNELSISVHTARTGPVARSAKARQNLHERSIVDSQKTECSGLSESEGIIMADGGIGKREALLAGEAPNVIEIEYERLRRQITASLVRAKASRDAAVSLRREIKSQQQFFEIVKKERDTMLKALRDKNVDLVIV